MGQKIHPLGFRVGITKRHQTVWFARFQKRQYAQTVLEDIFLRETLQKLLPDLVKKKYNNASQNARIAQIKIERGLIPYEIGIQIHAQNCEVIKSAIDKLEVNPKVFTNILKSNYILEKAAKQKNAFFKVKSSAASGVETLEKAVGKAISNVGKVEKNRKFTNKAKKGSFGNRRLQKRKNTLERFRQRILQNMLIVKKGKTVLRKFQKPGSTFQALTSYGSRGKGSFGKGRNSRFEARSASLPSGERGRSSASNNNGSRGRGAGKFESKNMSNNGRFATKTNQNDFSNLSPAILRSLLTENSQQSQKTTKFMSIFLSKTNANFVNFLKNELLNCNTYFTNYKQQQIQQFGTLKYAPLGYQKKWSLARLKRYENQPLPVLATLLKALQEQALRKLELLRKEYVILGTLPKMKSFAYFQRVRFIKALKNFIQQYKVQLLAKQKNSYGSLQTFNPAVQLQNEKILMDLKEKALTQKFSNLKAESRKVRLIEHLQAMVQKHRQKNLYLYLGTLSDSRKYLRQINKFTKEQVAFLFGLNSAILDQMPAEEKREFVKNQLKKYLQKANTQNELQRNLQEVFLHQIQQQKQICAQNLALMPKISLKFYSVKPEALETNANIVTAGIVDKLEKREAFRKVIKKVSEDLMKTSKVKGVKIQVSGRLNGAEIARSEWVRAGRVPLQTLRANIDYCYKTAQTIYGIIGVKVWIYRGYTKRNKNA
jgi:ribosomal protein S3